MLLSGKSDMHINGALVSKFIIDGAWNTHRVRVFFDEEAPVYPRQDTPY